MFSTDITLNTTQVYSLVSQRTNSSIRSDASQEVSSPHNLTISHENAKSLRRSSAVILDDTEMVAKDATSVLYPDVIRLMFKAQYNPFGGRTDNEAVIAARLAELAEFIQTPTFLQKFLNQET